MNPPHEFAVSGSDTLHIGRVFALRLDQVVMPGGRAARREIVEHPGAVAILPLHDDSSVVMIDQYRHAVGRRMRELPAGLLDAPGEDPVTTARRELVEEVGCTARDWSVLVDVVPSPGFSDEAVRVFLARRLTEVGRPVATMRRPTCRWSGCRWRTRWARCWPARSSTHRLSPGCLPPRLCWRGLRSRGRLMRRGRTAQPASPAVSAETMLESVRRNQGGAPT